MSDIQHIAEEDFAKWTRRVGPIPETREGRRARADRLRAVVGGVEVAGACGAGQGGVVDERTPGVALLTGRPSHRATAGEGRLGRRRDSETGRRPARGVPGVEGFLGAESELRDSLCPRIWRTGNFAAACCTFARKQRDFNCAAGCGTIGPRRSHFNFAAACCKIAVVSPCHPHGEGERPRHPHLVYAACHRARLESQPKQLRGALPSVEDLERGLADDKP